MISVNLTFENPSVLPMIEKLLAGIQGITKTVVDDEDFFDSRGDHILESIEELRSGKGVRCKTVDELFEKLNS
jgi:hypothetical protein